MELFAPILGMTMIVVGLILLTAGTGWLLYLIWQGGKMKATPPSDAASAPDIGSGGLQS